MFLWLIRSSLTLLVLAGLALVAVSVPIGSRTLVEHTAAIVATDPAQRLGSDLADTLRSVSGRVVGAFTEAASQPQK